MNRASSTTGWVRNTDGTLGYIIHNNYREVTNLVTINQLLGTKNAINQLLGYWLPSYWR